MFKWFDWVWRIMVVVIGIMIIWKFWVWWSPDPPTTYLRTDLINAQQSESFHTGFATVAMVRFETGGSELQPFSYVDNEANQGSIDGYCYRLFEVSIGYPSLGAAIASSESSLESAASDEAALVAITEPQVLTGNVLDARHGGSATQRRCDELNKIGNDRSNAERLESLKEILISNNQWDSHVEHARNVLTAFSATLAERRRAVAAQRADALGDRRDALGDVSSPDDLQEWKTQTRAALALRETDGDSTRRDGVRPPTGIADLDQILNTVERSPDIGNLKTTLDGILGRELDGAQLRLAGAGGYLGSLKLTFSTIGIFGQQAGRWFWKRDQFYIRQDLADAIYGSDFALDVSRRTVGLFGPKRLEIIVPEPTLLALDRYTATLVAKPDDFKRDNDAEGSEIEMALSTDLAAQLAHVEPQAIRFAKAALTAQIHALVAADVGEIRVRFTPGDSAPPRQLADLVRLMGQPLDADADR